MGMSDDNLLYEFVTESRDHLASIEPDLLILEKEGSGADAEIINRVFRAIHSIKGAAGFFGLEALKNLSHTMESVLMLIRDGKLVPSPQVMDPLLSGVDRLNQMLDDIHASENVEYSDLVTQLEAILNNLDSNYTQTVTVKAPAAEPSADSDDNAMPSLFQGFQPDYLSLDQAQRYGQRLFILTVSLDQDLSTKNRSPLDFINQLMGLGNLLDSAFDITDFPDLSGCLDATMNLMFLYASVLDADLISEAMDLPTSQIQPVEMSEILKDSGLVAPVSQEPIAQPPAPATESTEPVAAQTPQTTVEPPAPTPAPQPKASSPASPPEAKKAPQPAGGGGGSSEGPVETVRVRVDLLNRLMDLAGEMVLSRNQLLRSITSDVAQDHGLTTILQNVNLITSDLQEHIMQTRMQPIGSVFGKFPRVVRDLAKMLNKEIVLEMTGEEVELDKSIIESLSDPLTHLIRNSCDHGVEMPDDRQAAGKPRVGTIKLAAFHEGGQINISITDDGKGLDPEMLVRKAISKGVITEAEGARLSHQEILNLIFRAGFSTAEQISEVSGRGVGMDVVRTNIEKLGGSISIESIAGQGTTLLLRLPLTLAIIPSLIVGVSGLKFAVPQINLVELVRVKASEISSRIEQVGSASVLRLRGKLLPLVRLSDLLNMERVYADPQTGEPHVDRREQIVDERAVKLNETGNMSVAYMKNRRQQHESDYNIIVLKSGNNQFGLIIDEFFDTEEIVVKPLSSYLKNCKCFAGATILGDGKVAMILDVGGITNYSKLNFSEVSAEERRREQEALKRESESRKKREAIILFNNAPDEVFAIALSSVLRLEKIDSAAIKHVGHREFLTYRGVGLPIIRLDHYMSVKPTPDFMEELFLIIPKAGNGAAGIVASRILDTMEAEVDLDKTLVESSGVSGSAVLNDQLTLFIEPHELLRSAGIHY